MSGLPNRMWNPGHRGPIGELNNSSPSYACVAYTRAPGIRCVSPFASPRRGLRVLLGTVAILGLCGGLAVGEPAKPSAPAALATQLSTEELLRNLQCMEQRIRALEGKLKSQTAPAAAESPQPFPMRTVRVPGSNGKPANPSGPLDLNPPIKAAEPAAPAATPAPVTATPDTEPAEPAKTDTQPSTPATARPNTPPAAASSTPTAAPPSTPTAAPPSAPVAAPPSTPAAAPPSTPAAAPNNSADPCAPQLKSASTTPAKTAPSSPLLPPLPSGSPTPPPAGKPATAEQQLLPPLPGGPAPSGSTDSKTKGILGVAESPVPGLSIGAYGEIKFGSIQNPAASGQWQNGFDAHRLVLLPTYAITPNIIFNAEIEFEHGGIAFDPDDKLHGSVDVEQIFVDFLMTDRFNWRSPGIDLVPIGYINQHHEPTQFYSVKRPELYNGLIPSTWRVPATSIYGTITDGIKYQLQMSSSLEDFGDDFALRTDANTVPIRDPTTLLPIPYAPGITGLEALALARPVVGDFRQLSNVLAYAGQLNFTPPILPGLGWSVSAYYTPNTTPRGAHDEFGFPLGRSTLTMFDVEFRYRIPQTWVELRGEYVRANFGNPVNLRANNDGDPFNNVGRFMWGWSGEIALHIPLGTILSSEWKLVPFYRYTYQNLQTIGYAEFTGVAGSEISLPTGAGQTRFQDFGLALFASPKIVLKATYQRVRNNDPLGAQSDSILGGVGFFF
jgi:hypothetical protein